MLKKIVAILLPAILLLSGCELSAGAAAGSTSAAESVSVTTTAKTAASKPGTDAAGSPSTAPVTGEAAETVPNPPLPDTEFTIVASGDVLSHITNTRAARQKDGSYDFLPQFAPIGDLLADADYTLVNLESATAGEDFGYRGFPRFNAPVNLSQTLKKLGVDLAITANNHAMDNGMDGLRATLDNLDLIGLDHTGTFRTKAEAATALVRDINGIKVGFVASTFGTNYIPVPVSYAVNFNTAKKIRSEIAEARAQGAELIVYHVHWGREYTGYPSQKQMDTYRILTEEGVDVIIGSHPHRLQPMEMREITYQGKTKTQAVIWSTGNLWQGQVKNMDYINLGAIFKISVERRNGEIRVSGLDSTLVYNLRWKVNGKEQYKVIPEGDITQYEKDFPTQTARMKRELEWGRKNLKKKVKVVYSDGTKAE